MTRAVLYARVSSDDRHNESLNLNGQLALCREYASRQGYSVIEELAEDDRGASGADIELPKLSRAIELARADAFDVLVARELDRLSRTLPKQLIIEAELKKAGVKIEYALSEYPDTPEGTMAKQVRAIIAEFEREQIKIRTTRARRLHAKNGSVMSHGQRLYGYKIVTEGAKRALSIIESEAHWIRQVFAWYTVGDTDGDLPSIRGIAKRLSDLKVPTLTDTDGGHYKLRERCEWSSSSVATILSNAAYTGTWLYGRRSAENDPVAVPIPAIIDQATFDQAQARRAENRARRRRAPKYDYLMAKGRLRCACGYAISPVSIPKGNKVYLSYGCAARIKDFRVLVRKCDSKRHRAEVVDGTVWKWVRSLLIDEAVLDETLAAYQAERESTNAPLHARLAAVSELLADNQKQMRKLLSLYLATDSFSPELLLESEVRLKNTIAGLEAERGELTTRIEAQALTEDQLRNLCSYAARLRSGVQVADHDFAARVNLIALLDVRGIIGAEDGQDVIHLSCILGKDQLCLTSTSC